MHIYGRMYIDQQSHACLAPQQAQTLTILERTSA